MAKQKPKMEFRYYTMPEKELVLALTGDEWIQEYGKGIDYLHFHNFMEVGICHYGSGEVVLGDQCYHFCDDSYVIIPPNFPHTTNADEGTKAYWEWMYFDIDSVIEDAMKTESVGVRSRFKKELYRKAFFLRGEEHKEMEAVIQLILLEVSEKRSFYRKSVGGFLTAFVNEILRLYEKEAEDMQTQLSTILSSGDYSQLPDILLMQDFAYQKYAMTYQDLFTDLTDSGIDFSQFSEGKLNTSVVDGKNYGVPFDNGTEVAAYRIDLLEQAGYTVDDLTDIDWDKFIEIGKDVLDKTGYSLFSTQAKSSDIIMQMVQSAGGSICQPVI